MAARAILFTNADVVTFAVTDEGAPAPARSGTAYNISPGDPGHCLEAWLRKGWRIESFNSAYTLFHPEGP